MSTLRVSKTLPHETPLWIRESEEVFFITVCCDERGRNSLAIPSIAPRLVESVHFRHQSGQWICDSFVVMPDHVHGLFQFTCDQPMAKVIRNWKRWTSRQLGIVWQRNWFDHRIRRTEDRYEKANYIANNPVRAGLCDNANDWPYRISR